MSDGGGGDLCLENKVYIDLVPLGISPAPHTCSSPAPDARRDARLWQHGGAPHPHGMNFGVEARDGEQRFDSAASTGAVRAHKG
eukprot:3223768-Prymnesium_polylepis.1